jgi:hypothetical protein
VWAGLVGIVLGLLVTELVVGVGSALQSGSIGIDYVFYRDVGAGWLADGTYYRPHQLTGQPYHLRINESVVYPPAALLLFVPLVWTPAIVWWAVPLGALAYVLWGFRLSRWGWLVVAVLCLWPRLQSSVLYGNTDMWVAAGVAAGIRWGWPAALIALKPVFLPLALVGIRHWSTWALGAALLVVSLPLLPAYITVMRTVRFSPDYSVGSIVFAVLPLVAWALADRRRADAVAVGGAGGGRPALVGHAERRRQVGLVGAGPIEVDVVGRAGARVADVDG